MTNVLAVASEVFPLVKTGGLADVVGALPAAVGTHGIAMRTMLPGYPAVLAALADGATAFVYDDLFGAPARILPAPPRGSTCWSSTRPSSSIARATPISDRTGATGRTTGSVSRR